ncbi:hypothetical protein [Mammaliicoccus vitulinus]|uniref:hypothetical protein n=1 Tax=Mammaliicoccus vitulinus TaxID=71237 RepID=UPI00248C545E|nr:hypothetical protein [Mammaliicoccus vitulinus]
MAQTKNIILHPIKNSKPDKEINLFPKTKINNILDESGENKWDFKKEIDLKVRTSTQIDDDLRIGDYLFLIDDEEI